MKILVTILLHLIAGVDPQTLTDIYNFPMVGTLEYDLKTTYGSVTIVHKKMVLAAAENLVQSDPQNKGFIFTSDQIGRLFVVVGSDLMTPPDDEYDKGKIQHSSIDKIFFGVNSQFAKNIDVGKRRDFINSYRKDSVKAPGTVRGTTLKDFKSLGFTLNPFQELQWDVAIILLKQDLTWSSYVLPTYFHWVQTEKSDPVFDTHNSDWLLIEALEFHPLRYGLCSVPGWSPTGNNEIVYHNVVYVRFKECEDAICGAYPSSCLRYLNIYHHVCFKSLTFADSCVLDQGAPVLCKPKGMDYKNNRVLGIAVKTFECGTQGLPTVFTRMDAIEAFAAISDVPASYDKEEPSLDDPKYLEKAITIGPYR